MASRRNLASARRREVPNAQGTFVISSGNWRECGNIGRMRAYASRPILLTLGAIALLRAAPAAEPQAGGFEFKADHFADIQVLRYRVPGFDQLSLQRKKLAYYLY